MKLTQELVNELLEYRDGLLFWKVDHTQRRKKGDRADIPHADGYFTVRVYGRSYMSHQLVWLIFKGIMVKELDHIDNDRANNKINNLRDVSRSQNQHNALKRKDNKSGHKGVSWNKYVRLWRAVLHVNKKQVFIGNFWDIETAVQVLKIERLHIHKEYANNG